VSDGWSPDQYHRFAAERRQPFDDLVRLIRPVPGGRVLDLGCGTGELTVELHRHLQASATVGLDSSEKMLSSARTIGEDNVTFHAADIGDFADVDEWDVIAANASLHWVADHPALVPRLVAGLRPGGQFAAQVPANVDHPSHTTSAELAAGEFAATFPDGPPPDPVQGVLAPEAYAQLLDDLGAVDQHVRLQVYAHHLPSTAAVVEWVRGTSLTRFERVMTPEDFSRFLDRYREELLGRLGDHRPYFYAFKRILMWARF